MAQWGVNDAASNSVLWAVGQFKTEVNSTNRDAFYVNATQGDYITNLSAGCFGVSEGEVNTSNTSSEAYGGKIAHTGWSIRTEGSGGRAGRVHYEVIVAGGITGDTEDDNNYLGDN